MSVSVPKLKFFFQMTIILGCFEVKGRVLGQFSAKEGNYVTQMQLHLLTYVHFTALEVIPG